jgi:hypothetical protein
LSQDAQKAERRGRPARSRHKGSRRWVTYIGYAVAAVGLACLAVHLFAGWKLVQIDAMLPTYLWIVTAVLIVVGSVMVLVNEGVRRLDGSEEVAFGQVVSESAPIGKSEEKGGHRRSG